MYGAQVLMLLLACAAASSGVRVQFRGRSALEFTARAVALGPRPIASEAHAKLERMIVAHLRACGWEVTEDSFTAHTPLGPRPMRNLIGRLPGKSGKAVVITGHYDTKIMPGIRFVGANDGGSSAGFLMELARVLPGRGSNDDLYLVWFDGEEAVAEWTETDSLYGSRHLARRWQRDGTARRIKALINVDMIGDKELDLVYEIAGTAWLRELVWRTADELGHSREFTRNATWIGDDHLPFAALGVPAIDLIDFSYGPANRYWHTEQDTMDKLSAASLQTVGDVIVSVITKLEAK
ncbi:MAG TPA: M28 family peptidase [Bryobacteraceae bacterium]|nr:M28 family peptidase [Bryobacteraceae bacterium]